MCPMTNIINHYFCANLEFNCKNKYCALGNSFERRNKFINLDNIKSYIIIEKDILCLCVV